ncbi:hypothetical protein HBI56_045050 [Parastagonospora nodorum]|nr:hypothetical protein HBH52_111200 [Parastagonospora nodorum]KAH4349006.1 hypothetical protein HBH98_075220 [Parastagonospora nodorum]KAH4381362.1 hypothetical protein HBH99_192870 [Parastagonospora nodorum]KAH4391929.1 hypothetical protein HBH97_042870 [Parastagonospora nodorum]KAH4418079.1 hypothetical protein HBH92_054720 [Parastagonospora nodorum]
MAEPESDAISHEPDAVAAPSLIPSKRPASENGESTNATPKKLKDGAEAISVKDAAKKLFFPTEEELSEQELSQLSKIIFGDYLKLYKVPSASLTEDIRQFRLVKGSQVPFRLVCGFQLWLRETGQHASQAVFFSRLSKKLRRLLRDGSEEDASPNNSNTGAINPKRTRQTSRDIHKSNFGLPDWDQQLKQDTADMYARAYARDRAIENVTDVMSTIEEYASICSYNGLCQLAKLSGQPTRPQSIRHAPKPENLNEIISCTAVKYIHANLTYHSLYEVLQLVDDLSVIVAEGLNMLRRIRRFKEEIEDIDDPTLIDREGRYTSISVWNIHSGKRVKEVAKSVGSALKELVPRIRDLRKEYHMLKTVDKVSWDAVHGQSGSRDDLLKMCMHNWILYRLRTPPAVVVSNDFAARWRCWKALAQVDALERLMWHREDLQAALQALEKAVG